MQVLVAELMTDSDVRADGLVSQALQSFLLVLSASETASETEGLIAAADLVQHLIPSQKHLMMLQRHVQVLPLVHRGVADDQLAQDHTERHQISLNQCVVDTVLPFTLRSPCWALLTGGQLTIICVTAVVEIVLQIFAVITGTSRQSSAVQ